MAQPCCFETACRAKLRHSRPGFVLKRVLKGALDTGSKGFKKYVESR